MTPLTLERLGTLLLTLMLSAPALADAESPRPFTARYQLEVSGWPNATIEHRLTREAGYWQSRMQATIAVARGSERSHFVVEPTGVRSLTYASGYSLLGIGKHYRLGSDELATLPDRQAALFDLSRRATAGDCQAHCRLRYQDHEGKEESLDVRQIASRRLALPEGDIEAIRVEATEPDDPSRRLILGFHPEVPGLLLTMAYYRDDERRSRLALTDLALHQR